MLQDCKENANMDDKNINFGIYFNLLIALETPSLLSGKFSY